MLHSIYCNLKLNRIGRLQIMADLVYNQCIVTVNTTTLLKRHEREFIYKRCFALLLCALNIRQRLSGWRFLHVLTSFSN